MKSDKVVRFKGQNYFRLKRTALKNGEYFSDPTFPPNNESLKLSYSIVRNIVWKRPHEISTEAKLCQQGVSSHDVLQGQLGNCWFVSACSVLARVKKLWKKVVPYYVKQEFGQKSSSERSGIHVFRFWRFGQWIEVVVDDRLPTVNGQLIFVHSQSRNEFWPAMLEKAYAKLNGSYGSLEGGTLNDALEDFTSGVSFTINLGRDGNFRRESSEQNQLFNQLRAASSDNSLICSAISVQNRNEIETRTADGLVRGHAYGVTGLRVISLGKTNLITMFRGREKLNMIRLRNPWGQKEWKGAFSDGSKEWSKINAKEKKKLGLTFEDDGEFWMTFDDFVNKFTDISVCRLMGFKWLESRCFGEWSKQFSYAGSLANHTCGGCVNHKSTFLNNPQYMFEVHSLRESHLNELIVHMIQVDRRHAHNTENKHLIIGFFIMKVEVNRAYRLGRIQESAADIDYSNGRSLVWRGHLPLGRYVIVPSTFYPNIEGRFLLRIFSTSMCLLRELKTFNMAPMCSCLSCSTPPDNVISLTVVSVSGIQPVDINASANLFVKVKCANKSYSSVCYTKSFEAIWHFKVMFYCHFSDSVVVQVWNKNLLRNEFLGETNLRCQDRDIAQEYTMSLVGKSPNFSNRKMSGKIVLRAIASKNLSSL